MRFLTVIFLFVCGVLFSQEKLEENFKKVKTTWNGSKYEYTTGYFNLQTGESVKFIKVKNDRADLYYIFEKGDICIQTIVIPFSEGDLNFYCEDYNVKYEKLTDGIWSFQKLDVHFVNLIRVGENPPVEIPILINSDYILFR